VNLHVHFIASPEMSQVHERSIKHNAVRVADSDGVRDSALLESAVAAPQASFGGKSPYRDLAEVAAAYLNYLCRNHPFIDGDKRAALGSCIVFLRLNGVKPQEAFCMMATNVATGLNIEREDHIRPVTWDEWITLPIRPQDHAVHTVRGAIRVPTVIVAVNFARVSKKRPKLCARTIRERDGNRCQYTGKLLQPDEGSLDHVLPRSRGGKDTGKTLYGRART
jgi:death-on-curing family protein